MPVAITTQPKDWGLNVIKILKERYNVKVGFSDHSGTIYPNIDAVAMGAEILEFHAVFDRRMFGPDAKASLTIDEVAEVVKGAGLIYESLNTKISKEDNSGFTELKKIFEKSLAVNKDLPIGHVLRFEDLEAKKPKGYGIDAKDFDSVIGKCLKNSLKAYDFLNGKDI